VLRDNPLFVNLDDDDPKADKRELDRLRAKRKDSESKLDSIAQHQQGRPRRQDRAEDAVPRDRRRQGPGACSPDGCRRVRRALRHIQMKIGFTGSVITAVAEHARSSTHAAVEPS